MKDKYFIILQLSYAGKDTFIFFIVNKEPELELTKIIRHIVNHGSFIYQSRMGRWKVYGDKKEFHKMFVALGEKLWYRADRVGFINSYIIQKKCKLYPNVGLSIRDEIKFMKELRRVYQ